MATERARPHPNQSVCVILTLPTEPGPAPELPMVRWCIDLAGNSTVPAEATAAAGAGYSNGDQETREGSPLWVWLALALLACGALAYVAAVSIIEYLMAGRA